VTGGGGDKTTTDLVLRCVQEGNPSPDTGGAIMSGSRRVEARMVSALPQLSKCGKQDNEECPLEEREFELDK
jgi:hypothetical protein